MQVVSKRRRFVFYQFISVPRSGEKRKNSEHIGPQPRIRRPRITEADLELSLSLPPPSTYLPISVSDPSSERKKPMSTNDENNINPGMEEETEFLKGVADEIRRAPINLELSISVHPSSSRSYKKPIKTEPQENNNNKVLDHDPWVIKKKLNDSDIGDLCRILLTKDPVSRHILPFLTQEERNKIESGDGVSLTTLDVETQTEHQLVLRKWKGWGNHVLNGDWKSGFVKRRELKTDDEVGMYWDSLRSKLNFRVLKRGHGVQPTVAKKPRKKCSPKSEKQ